MRTHWLAAVVGLAVAWPCGAAPIPAQERIVILVTVDGLPAWIWDNPNTVMPTPAENQAMGDLVLFAKPGYAFKDHVAGEALVADSGNYAGTHGYLATDPELDGVLIAWGYGIQPGVRLPRISNVDVAPTLAELLGVQMPQTDCRILRELLR